MTGNESHVEQPTSPVTLMMDGSPAAAALVESGLDHRREAPGNGRSLDFAREDSLLTERAFGRNLSVK